LQLHDILIPRKRLRNEHRPAVAEDITCVITAVKVNFQHYCSQRYHHQSEWPSTQNNTQSHLKTKWKYFRSNVPRYPKEHCFLEGSWASSVCPFGERNMLMKTSMEHWWNDTDRGKLKYWERNIIQCRW
jgi:hypothetical protein